MTNATQKTFAVGKFSFAIKSGVTIPADIPRVNPNALPFADHFGEMGHHEELFIPTAFWTGSKEDGGREVQADKATIAYQKDKLRNQMKLWKDRAEPKGSREHYSLTFVPRLGSEEGYEGQPGLSVFMVYPEDKRPAPAKDETKTPGKTK